MHKILSVLPFVALTAVACAHEHSNVASTTTTTSGSITVRGAERVAPGEGPIEQIATARCERETRCDQVGHGQRFESYDHCVGWIRTEETQRLTDEACPRGVDSARLDQCVAAMKGERCGDAEDSKSRVAACDAKTLCKR
jgi:hypothetical protein